MTEQANWQSVCTALQIAVADLSDAALEAEYTDAELTHFFDAKCAAVKAFFSTPAPDIAALAQKLEFFIADDAHEYSDARSLVAAMLRDAKALAAVGGQA